MVVVSVLHKNLEMLLLGKSALIIVLKISKALLAANETKKDRMRGELFEEQVEDLDCCSHVKNRKMTFLVDNYPSHPTIEGLTNVDLVILPANTTFLLPLLWIRE